MSRDREEGEKSGRMRKRRDGAKFVHIAAIRKSAASHALPSIGEGREGKGGHIGCCTTSLGKLI